MRAPVYRNLDAQSPFLGLSFPGEALLFLAIVWGAVAALALGGALAVIAASYAALRLLRHGKPAGYWAHRGRWTLGAHLSGARLSAATPLSSNRPHSSAEHR